MQRPQTRRTPTAGLRLESLEAREVPAIGVLDTTFGTGGKVSTNIGYEPADVAVDSAGRVVVVGTAAGAGGTQDFAVTRFKADGTLDTAFGSGGKALVNFTAGGMAQTDSARAVTILAGDAILVVGKTGTMFGLAKLDATGTLDVTFGNAGGRQAVQVSGGDNDGATDVAVSTSLGKIVVVGTSLENANVTTHFAAAQLGLDGKVDGSVRLDKLTGSKGTDDVATAVAIDSQNRVIVVGSARDTTDTIRPAVARLTPTNGDPDTTFGTNGSLLITNSQATGFTTAEDVDTDASDNVYVAFQTDLNTVGRLGVAKLSAANGTLDTTYGTGGIFTAPGLGGGGQIGAVGVVVKPDGTVVAAGTGSPTGSAGIDFLILQTTAAGKLDTSFNSTGTIPGALYIDIGTGNDAARALSVEQGGKVVIAGTVIAGTGSGNAALARVLTTEPVTTGLPGNLSVGGSATGTAKVYAPTASGTYANPPASTTPATVFPGFAGDVRVATGDFNADGSQDTVLVTGPGTKTVMAIVSGKDNSVLLPATDPFGDANFTFGGFVTAGDMDRDGRAEWVVTPEVRGGPRVIIFHLLADGTFNITTAGQPSLVANFFGIGDPSFRDGDRPALGDVNGDGTLDVFSIAAFNGGPRTALYNGADVLIARAAGRDPVKLIGDFFAAPSGADEGRGGRAIAAGDVTGDGRADLIVTGDNLLGTGNQVTIFSGADLAAGKVPGFGATPVASFTVGGQSGASLVSVAAVDANRDGRADLVVGSGAGQASVVKLYTGQTVTGTAEPASTSLDPFGSATFNGVFVG